MPCHPNRALHGAGRRYRGACHLRGEAYGALDDAAHLVRLNVSALRAD